MAGIDIETAVRTFIRAWNTVDDGDRDRLLASCCVPDSEFSSPRGPPLDLAGLSRSIRGFLTAFPNATVRHGPADAHNGYARFRWHTDFNDGEREPIFGDDYVELGDDGSIRRVVSFDGSIRDAAD